MQDPSQDKLKQVAKKGFAEYGIRAVAYVKHTVLDGHAVYTVHAADGTYLRHDADEAVARAALRPQEMEPLSVH